MHFRLNRFRLNRTITFVHPFVGFDFLVKPETFFEEPIYIRSLIVNGKKFYKKFCHIIFRKIFAGLKISNSFFFAKMLIIMVHLHLYSLFPFQFSDGPSFPPIDSDLGNFLIFQYVIEKAFNVCN